MATILLQVAGSAIGSVFGPVGAMVGRAAGALAGSLIDRSLIASMTTIEGTHLTGARVPGAEEGTPVTRVYGTARVGGTLIWATRFEEIRSVEREGGKATGPRVETFSYLGNFAIGICEGTIADIRRVWADGREIDLGSIEMRLHRGTASQSVDPLIEAKQGAGNAPAYRGLAYVVFENLPLDPYGNRIPVFQFEVLRTVGPLEGRIRAITLIPGATEHGYDTQKVTEKIGEGEVRIINRNQFRASTDFKASVQELLALCPNLERVAIVASWFGTDLRAGHCRIEPGVEVTHRKEESVEWSVSGIGRGQARLISKVQGGPAFGGTPSDAGLISAIQYLKDRNIKVFVYPFLLMDVAPGNDLDNPYGGVGQPKFPWRGRITCNPAPGQPGSADRSGQAKGQVADFCGNAQPNDFNVGGGSVTYQGNDTGYRRMVLHYAHLATLAGGVNGIIIGSELRGLTTLRDGNDDFPFVTELKKLAADVRSIVGPTTKLTYGADWSEYFGYHPDDGSGDVYFHLDPLWATDDIDAVGIDNYMPLADWRDDDHTSANPDGAETADDQSAMKAAIISGEGYDWYYPSDNARALRNRSPITDGLAGKPWVYRYKDIENWWKRQHYNRIGGVEMAQPTQWAAKMKPIWLTELGCPAIDRGANQPNVFVDPASSESATPHHSAGRRSDCMQRRFLDAHLSWWNGNDAPANMVDPGHVFVWTFDARPWPAFPEDEELYADGGNWETGHWLNGRLGAGTLPAILSTVLSDHGFESFDVSAVSGDLVGLVVGDVASARQIIEPLTAAFRIDARMENGKLVFASRGAVSAPATRIAVFADQEGQPFFTEKRSHDSDFASQAVVDFSNQSNEYEQMSSRSRRMTPANDRVMRIGLPAVMAEAEGAMTAEYLLRDLRLSARSVSLAVSPRAISLEPGDVIEVEGGPAGRFRIDRIEDGEMRMLEAHETGEGDIGNHFTKQRRRKPPKTPAREFSPVIQLMDLARYKSGNPGDFACAAVTGKPWKTVMLSTSPEQEGFQARATIAAPARIGRLTQGLGPGPIGLFDEVNALRLELFFGEVQSVSRLALFNGANRLAVRAANGEWEVIGFADALEEQPGQWMLSGLLRGLAGTGDATAAGALADSPIVVLDDAVQPIGLLAEEAGMPVNVLAEAAGQAGGTFGPFAFSGGMRAETPLAPVHLRARRKADGEIEISFIRAGRIDADSWEGAEIPMDEEEEGYLLEIIDNDTVKRGVELTQAFWTYPPALELADFGASLGSIEFSVRQKGRKVALGIAAKATINLQ